MFQKSQIFSIDGRKNLLDRIIKSYNNSVHSGGLLIEGRVTIQKFADNEITVQYDRAVRGHGVFLLCSTNSSDNIMRLMLASDAARRASADEVVAIIPYYGYARQDRKDGLRGPIGARVIANMLRANGVDRIIVVDLHAEQIQGFFNIPVDHINGHHIFISYLKDLVSQGKLKNLTLCSPDTGGAKRVDKYFKRFPDATMVLLSKRRSSPNKVQSMQLIGDVKDRDVVIIDDIVDTAGTLCKAAECLTEAGASSVRAICTHGVLSGAAEMKIKLSPITELIVSDTLDRNLHIHNLLTEVSCADSIAKIIKAINNTLSAKVLIDPDEQ